MTNILATDISKAPEGGSCDSNSSFDQYTGSGSVEERSLVRKQDWRIIPLCSVVYLLCFLDRSNIGIEQTFAFSQISPDV